jgi:superfamily II DNA or RNA helicase
MESNKIIEKLDNTYLSKRGYVIRKNDISSELYIDLKLQLRGKPLIDTKYNKGYNDTSFPVYIETKNKLYIPKVYGIKRFGKAKTETSNYIGEKWKYDNVFNGNLYENQKIACKKLLDELLDGTGGGILSLASGFGKTISCLYVLSQLKYKAIIIVNKIALMKQWESEIKTFLPTANIGFIQGKKTVDTKDKDIIIAMLQSLSKISYPDEIFEDIGVTVIDETHHISSPVFSKILTRLCSRYTIGLSATPNRSDGCEYVFKWFLGDIVYQSDCVRKGLPPIINVVKIESNEYKEITVTNKVTGMQQIMYTNMLNDLIKMQKRNKLIIEIIKHYILNENRKILLLSDRREHLNILYKLLDNDINISFTYGLFVGQMKISELEKSKACQVILATYQAFGEGVSEKDLDTLILATPKKFIGHLKNVSKNESGKLEQIVGRIFRKEHTDKNPLIIDFNDDFSIYNSQFYQRKVFYKNHFQSVSFKNYNISIDDILLDDISFKKLLLQKKYQKDNEKKINNVYTECLLD